MELDKIVLYGEDSIQKEITNLEWFSEQFICYKKGNETEVGLLQHCVGFQGDDIDDPNEMGKSNSIKIGGKEVGLVGPQDIEGFIQRFIGGLGKSEQN